MLRSRAITTPPSTFMASGCGCFVSVSLRMAGFCTECSASEHAQHSRLMAYVTAVDTVRGCFRRGGAARLRGIALPVELHLPARSLAPARAGGAGGGARL